MKDNIHQHRIRRLIGFSLGFFTVVLDTTALNIALPDIERHFDTSLTNLQWTVSAYILSFASLLLTAGKLADRIGIYRCYVIGTLFFAAVSGVCAVSWNISALIGFRFLQGAGAAVIMTTALAAVAYEFPEAKLRGRALGVFTVFGTTGLFMGPIVGGMLTDAFGWQSIFLVNLLIAVAIIALCSNAPSNMSANSEKSIDLPGQLLAIVTLASLATMLIEGPNWGWISTPTLLIFLLTTVLGSLFLIVESKAIHPMLPLSIFRTPTFAVSVLASGSTVFAMYGLLFFLSLYFHEVRDFSASKAGLALLPFAIGPLPGNIFAGSFIHRFGARAIGIGGLLAIIIGALGLVTVTTSTSYFVTSIAMLVMGFGCGLVVPSMAHTAFSEAPKEHLGIASGVLNTCRQVGVLMGVAILGSFAGNEGIDGMHKASLLIVLVLSVVAITTIRVFQKHPNSVAQS